MRPFRDGFLTALRRPFGLIGFFLLNLSLGMVGTAPFHAGASGVLEHSLAAQRLLHGFDVSVWIELMVRPEMGQGAGLGSGLSALLFALASLLFMPGVLYAYAAPQRISRDAFFAACGHHVWRFVRLTVIFLLGGAVLAGGLGLGVKLLVDAAGRSTRERLPFWVGLGATLAALVIMTLVRMWFDLAQAHVVIRDQKAVRKSLAAGFRLVRARGFRLLATYLVINLLALAVLIGGLRCWYSRVPSASVLGAFLVGQGILLLFLFARFWQRAAAVAVVASV